MIIYFNHYFNYSNHESNDIKLLALIVYNCLISIFLLLYAIKYSVYPERVIPLIHNLIDNLIVNDIRHYQDTSMNTWSDPERY